MIPFRFHIAILLAFLTAVPMSRYPENQKVRKPAVAGSFYPASAREIKSMAGPWLHPAAGVAPGQYRPRCGLLNRKGIVQHHRFHRLLLPAGDRRPNQAGKYQNPFHIDQ